MTCYLPRGRITPNLPRCAPRADCRLDISCRSAMASSICSSKQEGRTKPRRPCLMYWRPFGGPDPNILSVFGPELVTRLLAAAYRVTLRPHPSFYLGEQRLIAQLRAAGAGSALFSLENPIPKMRPFMRQRAHLRLFRCCPGIRRIPEEADGIRERGKESVQDRVVVLGIEPVEVAMRSRLGVIVADSTKRWPGIEQLGRAPDLSAASIAEVNGIPSSPAELPAPVPLRLCIRSTGAEFHFRCNRCDP